MAIAQMNWGRLRYSLDHPDMADLNEAMSRDYVEAEQHPGFIWRIPDIDAADQLRQMGFDDRMSATVSVWDTVGDLSDFTFSGDHVAYFTNRSKWFETILSPQLVLWDVLAETRPKFEDAFRRLERLETDGPSSGAYHWPPGLDRSRIR